MSDLDKHIYISAGEASGDLLGADLARALLQKNPSLQLTGMGADRMRDEGVKIIFDSKKLSLVGIIEIIAHLPRIFWYWHKIKSYLKKTRPDLIILIDFPDTHFRFFKIAKKLNIPILYYVSPQIWAWRANRIRDIKKYVSHMAVLFSFEEKIYRDAGVPVTFVGHPLGNIVKPSMSVDTAYDYFHLNRDNPIIALFPGSRNSELKNHLPVMLDSVEKIHQKIPNAQFVLVLAPNFNRNQGLETVDLRSHIQIIQDPNHLYDLLQITHAAIAVSGTVTLEIALMNVPLCVIYHVNFLTAFIMRFLIHTKYIGLCNIVAEKLIAKEFVQDKMTSEAISNEIARLVRGSGIRDQGSVLRNNITAQNQNASEMVANIAIQIIGNRSPIPDP